MNKKLTFITLAFVAVLIATLACGSDNSGVKVNEGENTPVPTLSTYGIGDSIEVGDHIITLNEVEFKRGVVQANFTIENTGSDDLCVGQEHLTKAPPKG